MGRVAEHIGGRTTLALGTALAAIGYVIAGYSAGLIGLCVALVVVGCGLSTQHPIASAAVSRAYQGDARGPLGTYNFAGDIGKAAIPSGASLLLALMSWHHMLWAIAALGVDRCGRGCDLSAGEPAADRRRNESRTSLFRRARRICAAAGHRDARLQRPHGISDLPAVPAARAGRIAVDDRPGARAGVHRWRGRKICLRLAGRTTRRAGYGAPDRGGHGGCHPGRSGAAACRRFGAVARRRAAAQRHVLGALRHRAGTGAGRPHRKAFAIFYTGTIGASATAPILFGILGDAVGAHAAVIATAITAAVILPLAVALAPRLPAVEPVGRASRPSSAVPPPAGRNRSECRRRRRA